MDEEIERIERLKRDAFGQNLALAKVKSKGSGISESLTISLDALHDPDRVSANGLPWTETPDMVRRLFGSIFLKSGECPGRDRLQCCQALEGHACFPKWIEHEDPEWYALQLSKLLSLIDDRIAHGGSMAPSLAADEAFELGSLFSEALGKFRWDAHAKRGQVTQESARLGGQLKRQGNRRRRSPNETIDAVDKLLAEGKSLTRAYAKVGKEQGVTAQTIGKEYRALKKQR